MKPILRKVDAGQDHSFSIREDIRPFLYNHWHYHPELELTFIRKGVGNRLVGDSMEHFSDGDLILLGANVPHMWRSDKAYFQGNHDLHIEAIAIHFTADFWGTSFLNLPELKTLRELFLQARRGIKISPQATKSIAEKLEQILTAGHAQRVGLLILILDEIVGDKGKVLLSSQGFINLYNTQYADKINQIFSYTFTHFQNPLSIKEIAEAVNLSKHSFCRYFKTRTLKTYWQFLTEVRIGYACKLLIEGKMSVTQICYECGFNNLSNFNRSFKLVLKRTPLEYAKEFHYPLV